MRIFFLLARWCALLGAVAYASGCGDAQDPSSPAPPPGRAPTGGQDPPSPDRRRPPAVLELLVTSGGQGRLEECKCALRYANIMRRTSILRAKRDRPILVVDAGSFLSGPVFTLSPLRQRYLMRAYAEAGYDAVVPGRTELMFPKKRLDSIIAGHERMFVCANYVYADSGEPVFQPYKLVKKAGFTVGVIGVADANGRAPAGMKLTREVQAIRAVMPQVEARSDVVVVVGMVPLATAEAIARAFPRVALVITSPAGGASAPAQRTVGPVALFHTGRIRSAVAHLRATYDPETGKRTGLTHQILLADAQTPVDREVARVVEAYQAEAYAKYQGIEKERQLDASGTLMGTVHERTGWKNAFAGVAACGSCHAREYDVWARSAHAHAYQTLVEEHNSHANDSCVVCHTVGMGEPDGFDFQRPKSTAFLVNVGCESCHGRGGLHAVVKEGKVKPSQVGPYALAANPKQACITCHTRDNSPKFDFETYWAKIAH